MTSDEELMRAARKRAEEKVGFYIHLTVYVAVNLLLVVVWWFSGARSRSSSLCSYFGELA
jgi:hypothetical protein